MELYWRQRDKLGAVFFIAKQCPPAVVSVVIVGKDIEQALSHRDQWIDLYLDQGGIGSHYQPLDLGRFGSEDVTILIGDDAAHDPVFKNYSRDKNWLFSSTPYRGESQTEVNGVTFECRVLPKAIIADYNHVPANVVGTHRGVLLYPSKTVQRAWLEEDTNFYDWYSILEGTSFGSDSQEVKEQFYAQTSNEVLVTKPADYVGRHTEQGFVFGFMYPFLAMSIFVWGGFLVFASESHVKQMMKRFSISYVTGATRQEVYFHNFIFFLLIAAVACFLLLVTELYSQSPVPIFGFLAVAVVVCFLLTTWILSRTLKTLSLLSE